MEWIGSCIELWHRINVILNAIYHVYYTIDLEWTYCQYQYCKHSYEKVVIYPRLLG